MLRFFIKNKRIIILLILFVTSLTLFARGFEKQGGFGFFSSIFVRFFAPPLKLSTLCLKKANQIWQGYFYLVDLRKENQNLQDLLQKLLLENQLLREKAKENRRLRDLLRFKREISSPIIPAEIIGRDPTSWFRTLLIDKGASAGIRPGLAVITSNGVVGQLLTVGQAASKVLLIVDGDSAIDALIQRSRSRGIIEGRTESLCELRFVAKTEDVIIGDLVVTSGLNGIFPKGVLMGKVAKVNKQTKGFFQKIEVAPAVNFSKLEEVLVVLK